MYTPHDGLRSISLDLLTNSFPNAPFVSNFAEAQSVNPAADFLLEWMPFLGATPGDDIQVELWSQSAPDSPVFQAPTNPPFSGTNTSIAIPGNTLLPGQTYVGFLVFRSPSDVDTNSYPGVTCTAAYDTFTVFRLRTVASPVLQLSIGLATVTLSWPSVFEGFTPEASVGLGPFAEWLPVTNTPVASDGFYVVTLPRTNAGVFYRLIQN
jgi:hypothetical protein